MNQSSMISENKSKFESDKTSVSTNVNEPSPDYGNYAKENEINEKLSFPEIEIETADSFLNSGNGNQSQGSFFDLEAHQRNLSNLFDSSASAIFDESEIDMENSSFVSEISSLAFSTSNISSLHSPTSIHRGQKRRNKNYDKESARYGRRKKKNKNRLFSEDDFLFNSPDNFLDYFQIYEDPSMPAVMSKRWNKKQLGLRKEIVCAYRAEDSRINDIGNENTQQKLREEEEMRREKIADYDISSQNNLPNSSLIYDDQDKELEIDEKQLQFSNPNKLNTDIASKEIDIPNDEERETSEFEIDSIEEPTLTENNISPILILSLAIRFFFYVGYIFNLC